MRAAESSRWKARSSSKLLRGDTCTAVLCCGLGAFVPPARAVLSAPVCELWVTGHAGRSHSLSGKSSAAPSWTRLSFVPTTSGDLGLPSPQRNYLLCLSPMARELGGRGRGNDTSLLAWFSNDTDRVCRAWVWGSGRAAGQGYCGPARFPKARMAPASPSRPPALKLFSPSSGAGQSRLGGHCQKPGHSKGLERAL